VNDLLFLEALWLSFELYLVCYALAVFSMLGFVKSWNSPVS